MSQQSFPFHSLATGQAIREANHILIYSILIDILKLKFLFPIQPFITLHTDKEWMATYG